MNATENYASPVRPGLIKAGWMAMAVFFLLLSLFFVYCLSAGTELLENSGGFDKARLLAGNGLYARFGLFAWSLPVAGLLSVLLIWKARAVNSIIPLWVGAAWTMICGAYLLGVFSSGQSSSFSGEVGRLMAERLEMQLGGWVSVLLAINLFLIGLALVCWAIMPWLWQWRKRPEKGFASEVANEQELLRQAVLQGVKDSQAKVAQVIRVEVELLGFGQETDASLEFAANSIDDDEPVVNISIGDHPEREPLPPQGAYLRPYEPKAMSMSEEEPLDPLYSGEELTQNGEPGKMPVLLAAEPEHADNGHIKSPAEESQEADVIYSPYVCQSEDGYPDDSHPLDRQTDDDPLAALYDDNPVAQTSKPVFAATLGTESAPEQAGPKILPRQDEPITDAGGQAAFVAGSRQSYKLPSLDLLQPPPMTRMETQRDLLANNSRLLEEKLAHFGVQGNVVEVAPGPVVTMYEFKPAPGVKISKVAGLSDDLAMNLKATSVRIVAPIPGKSVIGIEIPSPQREMVYLRELLASDAYRSNESPLTVALGKDILGQPVVSDLSRMPHLLIAGATGAGKSVFINTLILSILYRSTPEQVRLLMVDPKRIELSTYNHIPHLLYPIITQPKDATAGLRWAVAEMERRYDLLAEMGVRNIQTYNQRVESEPEKTPLPYLVVIIDELSDLMMVASKEVETLITRLAQMARASGIHLVLATQRPSVDVITGLIKANFPARLSFQVSSRIDSRTILDTQGAENLLGAGDMLFLPPGTAGLRRLHGAFVSDEEIERVVEFVRGQGEPQYDESIVQKGQDGEQGEEVEEDELYGEAVAIVKQSGQASISYVQRRLRVGYNRAARMIEQMEIDGIVGPSDGSRPREVLIRS